MEQGYPCPISREESHISAVSLWQQATHMLNKDPTRLTQSLLSMPKSKYRREQVKERFCQQVATDAAPYLV